MGLLYKRFIVGLALWVGLSQVMFGVASVHAQGGLSESGIDVEPPLIEHEVLAESEADVRQSFVATVVDDDELDSVSLYYRFENDPVYSSVLMKRISYSSTYIVHVPTDPESLRDVEYYIQARDKAGNRTVRGYAFNPLIRRVVSSQESLVTTPATQTSTSGVSNSRKVLYVVLGVLAAGVAASAIANAGDDGAGCSDQLCQITINVVQPQ